MYNEYEESLKRINLNISDDALDVVYKDTYEFMNDDKKYLSSFLNIIFKNFYEEANASLDIRLCTYENKLNKVLNVNKKSSEELKAVIQSLKNVYLEELIEKIKSNKEKVKTKNRKEIKFKLNNSNYDIITNGNDIVQPFYNNKNRIYLNALFEEYSKLDAASRELIYFKDHSDKVSIAIKLKNCMISIKTKNNKSICINPYTIYKDKTNTSCYLVGTTQWNKLFIIRLKNIISIKLESIKSIDKENFDLIDSKIKEHGIANANGVLIETKIKLSDEGIKKYNLTLNMRPKVQSIDNDIYTFNTSEFQIINYFFRFGKDATIISPLELKEKFKLDYKEALAVYEL